MQQIPSGYLFEFESLLFPVKLYFDMIISKAHGQLLMSLAAYLRQKENMCKYKCLAQTVVHSGAPDQENIVFKEHNSWIFIERKSNIAVAVTTKRGC
jgi:hypothetical protein